MSGSMRMRTPRKFHQYSGSRVSAVPIVTPLSLKACTTALDMCRAMSLCSWTGRGGGGPRGSGVPPGVTGATIIQGGCPLAAASRSMRSLSGDQASLSLPSFAILQHPDLNPLRAHMNAESSFWHRLRVVTGSTVAQKLLM